MRKLLVVLAVLTLSATRTEAAPSGDPAAPAEERRPEARPTPKPSPTPAPAARPAPRPAPRPATPAPKPSDTRFEPSPRSHPLAEPYAPVRRDPVVAPAPREPVAVPAAREPVFAPVREPVTAPAAREPVTAPIRVEPSSAPVGREPGVEPKDRPVLGPDSFDAPHSAESYVPKVARPDFRGVLGEPDKRAFDGVAPIDHTPRDDAEESARRPLSHGVGYHSEAHHAPPPHSYYHPCYAGWWVHPYYRWTYVTFLVVDMPYYVSPWDAYWVPASRGGWMWVPGQWFGGYWYPGHWEPLGPAPYYYGSSYAYVPGFWWGNSYFEGYWRVVERPGFVWVDSWYVDRRPVWGHWRPESSPERDGYVWEPGFWNGETWVEGFWRPESRVGFRWVSAAFDESGVFHTGYWEPIEDRPGHVWIPGWFDGVEWVSGYWVTEREYGAADPKAWTPPEDRDAGTGTPSIDADLAPLAIPVQ